MTYFIDLDQKNTSNQDVGVYKQVSENFKESTNPVVRKNVDQNNAYLLKSSSDGIYMVSTRQNEVRDDQASKSNGIYMAGMLSRNKMARPHEDGATHAQQEKMPLSVAPKPEGK